MALEEHVKPCMTFAERLQKQLSSVPDYKGPVSGKGFVIAGGGPYEAGAFVAASIVRARSTLPIVLVRRPAELIRVQLFEALQVQVITVPEGVCRSWSSGWPIKSWCLTAGVLPFSDVHFLDSDVVPWGNVEKAFEASSGAWYCTNHHEAMNWAAYGLKAMNLPIDGGVWRMDTQRHWKSVWMFDWLNRHVHQESYCHGVGDQDQLRAAWSACGIEATLAGVTVHGGPGLIHAAGYTHRFADKFRSFESYRLGHWPWPQKHTGIPGEEEAYDYFRRYWRIVRRSP